MDIAEEPAFNQILLTHNFDFFRTVNSRFIAYSHCLMASKTANGLSIEQAKGIKNPFVNDWKRDFFRIREKRIASIPFLRNIVEYTSGREDPTFVQLTALMHFKPSSQAITQGELDKHI